MSNEVTTTVHPALATMPDAAQARGVTPEAWHVLKTVLFKGASDEMLLVLVDYCKASKRDPLRRPFHIVRVWDNDERKYVESLWPSIGELRTTAIRTGAYAGKAEIRFGPDQTKTWGSGNDAVTVTFPEWAQCSVFRMCGGARVEFAGSPVYWLEAYAKVGKTGAPNSMWQKRPRGQIAKCAEADALRSAFPEEWSQPTAEEMEGQTIEQEYGPAKARDVTPTATRFGRARFAASQPEHDEETGELRDAAGNAQEAAGEAVAEEAHPVAPEPSAPAGEAPAETAVRRNMITRAELEDWRDQIRNLETNDGYFAWLSEHQEVLDRLRDRNSPAWPKVDSLLLGARERLGLEPSTEAEPEKLPF